MNAKDIETELVQLEKQYWQAIKDRDVDVAMRLTDDHCIVTGAQGVVSLDKPEMAAMMNAANYTLDDFELEDDVEVLLLSDDVAILAYKAREDLTVDGEPVTMEVADASTWVRRNGRWVCALHTEAIYGDPFGRDRDTTNETIDTFVQPDDN